MKSSPRWSQHPFLWMIFKERDLFKEKDVKLYRGACLQPEQPSIRIPLSGSASSWQNEEGLQRSSVSLLHNITAATRRAASDPPTRVQMSHWEHAHGRRWISTPSGWGRHPMSHSCLITVSLTGSELWAEAVTWKVKCLRKSSQTTLFLTLPVPAWAAIPKWDPPHRDHPCDVIPSQTEILLGMLRAAKQAAGLCPATSGSFTAFRAALKHDHQPSRTFLLCSGQAEFRLHA